jgi:large conductance mechanosensitive channel
MSFFSEFKTFAMKGNVVDMATGIVIGAAFGKVIMPPIGVLIGGIDFSSLAINIGNPVADAKGVVTGGAIIKYGVFLNTIIQFIIIALAIFLVIKLMNRMVKKQEAAPATPPPQEKLLTEIRDLLKAQK